MLIFDINYGILKFITYLWQVDLKIINQPKVLSCRVNRRGSRVALTSDRYVNKVAEALCREWYGDISSETETERAEYQALEARFWEEFRHESQTAILAYLNALDEAGYRIFHPDDA